MGTEKRQNKYAPFDQEGFQVEDEGAHLGKPAPRPYTLEPM